MIFDNIVGSSWDDPKTLAALAAARALLGRGGTMQRITDAGLGYGGALDAQANRNTLRERANAETLLMQMKAQEFLRQQQAAQQAAQTRGSFLDKINPNAGPAMPFNAAEAMLAGLDTNEIKTLSPPATERKIVGNEKLGFWDLTDPQNPRRLVDPAPREVNMNDLLIPDGKGGFMVNQPLLDAKKQIAQSGASTQSVTLSSPMAVQTPDGKTVLVQPANRPGAPAQVLTDPATGKPFAPSMADKPLTEAQSKATAFASQMSAAERELSGVPIDQTKLWSQVETKLAAGAPNLAVSAAAQRARQAQEQWAEAFLRFKTGAASTEDEVRRNVQTYFPQPGDSKETVAQKERMRQQAVQDVLYASGPGASNVKNQAQPKQGGNIPRITSEAEYNALPSGSQYIAPDGTTRRKK